jgi:hypothetical protein
LIRSDIINYLFRKFSVEKSARTVTNIYPLKDGFGLLEERASKDSFISLIFPNLCRGSLQKLQTVKYPSDWIKIIVNKADPTTFILNDLNNDEQSTRICKIVDKTIIIGDVVEIGFYPYCFYNKFVYGLNWYERDEDSVEVGFLFKGEQLISMVF